MKPRSQDTFLPLFVLQLPQKTLARYGLGQHDWTELLAVLLDIDIGETRLEDALISLDDFCKVFRLATNLFGRERHLQAYVQDIRARHMGPVGLAMEAAPTIDDSLTLWTGNADILAPMLEVIAHEAPGQRMIELRLGTDLGDIADTYMELVLLMTAALIRNLSGGTVTAGLGMMHAQLHPDDFYRESFGLLPRFGQQANTLEFATGELARSNDYYAPLIYQQALQGIRDLRANLENHQRLGFRARKLLLQQAEEGVHLTLEDVAAQFNMSVRSFSRHLREEDLSFRDLRADVQFTIARRLLGKTRLPIKAIADRAGFSNLSAFCRAFHAAHGQTPQEYRLGVDGPAA